MHKVPEKMIQGDWSLVLGTSQGEHHPQVEPMLESYIKEKNKKTPSKEK
jgi:hypothetical protein